MRLVDYRGEANGTDDGIGEEKADIGKETRDEKRGSQQLRGSWLVGPSAYSTGKRLDSGFENAGAGLYRHSLNHSYTHSHIHVQLNNCRGGESRRKELAAEPGGVEREKKAAQGSE